VSPDRRQHRGAHPADKELFGASRLATLRRATSELSWLLGRGYSIRSSLKLVGDRHNLTERQRLAVSRAACSDEQREKRNANCLPIESMRGERLAIDGFNLIITIEAALAGGALIRCRDGCIRDLASVHGSYRSVSETQQAIRLVGDQVALEKPQSVTWFLDKPISNSGRLAEGIRSLARERDWAWRVEVVNNPDAAIVSSGDVAVTSDSIILDRATRWINLVPHVIERNLPDAWVIDLRQ
jgi:hypothetical protein